jgi:hypothetical protein
LVRLYTTKNFLRKMFGTPKGGVLIYGGGGGRTQRNVIYLCKIVIYSVV